MAASGQQEIISQLVKTGSTPIVAGFYEFLWAGTHELWITDSSQAAIIGGGLGTSPGFRAIVHRIQVTFATPTCTVNTPSQFVDLANATAVELGTVNAVAGTTDFSISLVCQGGMTLHARFIDNAATSNSSNVLTNTVLATQAGVGLQILRNGNPVNFDTDMTITTVVTDGTAVNIPLKAQYVRQAGAVTAGLVQGSFTYTLTYQ